MSSWPNTDKCTAVIVVVQLLGRLEKVLSYFLNCFMEWMVLASSREIRQLKDCLGIGVGGDVPCH